MLLHGDLTQENILGSSVKPSVSAVDLTAHLTAIGCAKYAPILVEQEELTLASLATLDDAHLKALGIPLGPRLAILQSHAKPTAQDGNDDAWETCSSSSESSETEGDGDEDESSVALQAKRQAKYLGPHEWTPSFVIDFADAKTGDPLYDLVAVFFAALVRSL